MIPKTAKDKKKALAEIQALRDLIIERHAFDHPELEARVRLLYSQFEAALSTSDAHTSGRLGGSSTSEAKKAAAAANGKKGGRPVRSK